MELLGRILCDQAIPNSLVQALLKQTVDVPHGFLAHAGTAGPMIIIASFLATEPYHRKQEIATEKNGIFAEENYSE